MKSQFLMTTSPNFDGLEIEGYLGIVTANVVTGTGLFSDIAASFSDFFGGRSNSYKKQLDSIREEAIREIESKARALGANAVVGLSIDNDQVSGKNSQMLMISVTATAVKLKKENNSVPGSLQAEVTLSTEEVLHRVCISEIRHSTEQMRLERLFQKYQDLFTAPPSIELASVVVQKFLNLNYKPDSSDSGLPQFLAYMELFSVQELKPVIYAEIKNLESPLKSIELVLILSKNLAIYDNVLIAELIGDKNKEIANCGLVLALSAQAYFTASDIKKTEDLINRVTLAFPTIRELQEHKKMLGKVQLWTCANGHENDSNTRTCSGCRLTRRDSWANSYEDVIEKLTRRVESLKIAFNQ